MLFLSLSCSKLASPLVPNFWIVVKKMPPLATFNAVLSSGWLFICFGASGRSPWSSLKVLNNWPSRSFLSVIMTMLGFLSFGSLVIGER